MTAFQVAGLIIAVLLNGGLGIALRFYATRHWQGPHGVLYRQGGGLALIVLCAAFYRWIFEPPFDGLVIVPGLALEVLVIVLLLEREGILGYEPPEEPEEPAAWGGITKAGNTSHGAIWRIENALAAITRAQETEIRAERYLEELERDLLQAWLLLGDLRHMRPVCSVQELRQRVEERLEGGGDGPQA